MESVTFTLPQIASSEMSKDEQGALLVNQATAVIISAWFSHLNAHIAAGDTNVWVKVSPGELATLVNDVQAALKNF